MRNEVRGLALVVTMVAWLGSVRAQEAAPDPGRAEFLEVIHTRSGNVWKGIIVEQVPGESYRIALAGGSITVVPAADVVRITKERNPSYQPAGTVGGGAVHAGGGGAAGVGDDGAAGGATDASVSRRNQLPAPVARPGVRLSVASALVFPSGDWGEGDVIDTSPMLTLRAGREFMFGHLGITPAARVSGIYWSTDLVDLDRRDIKLALLNIGGEVRLASHLGSFVPYGALGLGLSYASHNIDDVDNSLGIGLDIDLGLDILATPTFGIGLALNIHPGFTPATGADGEIDVTYMSLGAQVSLY